MRFDNWGGAGYQGRFVKIRGKNGVFVLTEHAGDCFYKAENLYDGTKSGGYLGDFEFLPEDYFGSSEGSGE